MKAGNPMEKFRQRGRCRGGLPWPPMGMLLDDLDAFLQEHRRCGELDGGVDGARVWMACSCGAVLTRFLARAGLSAGLERRRASFHDPVYSQK